MKLQARIRYLIRSYCPGLSGSFSYFGTRIYFPKGSVAFRLACEQGIFEWENVRLLRGLARPRTWVFDVGANIGLMSVPVLAAHPEVHVLSLEPSANVIEHLRRSASEGIYRDRWHVIAKGAGDCVGRSRFMLSGGGNDVYDGLRDTGRVDAAREVEIEMTTLDSEWERLGRPRVSAIKIDVEGAETQVLAGAARCLADQRPLVLLEWNRSNLVAYGYEAESLLTTARDLGCSIYAMPSLVGVNAPNELQAQMTLTESFVLLPR